MDEPEPAAPGGLDDGTVDQVIAELTTHIRKLEAKRLQLIHQRGHAHERAKLIALVGKDAKAADEILLILDEFQRAPGLLKRVLSAEISVPRAAQLAAAVQGVSDERFDRDLATLTEWVTANKREELAANLRRWRRFAVAEEGQYTI